MQLQFSPGCMSLISSDVQTLDLSHTSVLLSRVCVSVYIHLFLYLSYCSVQYFVWCPLLVSSLCFPYCFIWWASVFAFMHLVLWSAALSTCVFTFCGVCLCTSPGVYFVYAFFYFLYIHLFYFYIIFLLFILIGTYFCIWG